MKTLKIQKIYTAVVIMAIIFSWFWIKLFRICSFWQTVELYNLHQKCSNLHIPDMQHSAVLRTIKNTSAEYSHSTTILTSFTHWCTQEGNVDFCKDILQSILNDFFWVCFLAWTYFLPQSFIDWGKTTVE